MVNHPNRKRVPIVLEGILTTWRGPTNTRDSRITACTASGHRITRSVSAYGSMNIEQVHRAVAMELVDKLGWRTDQGPWVQGSMPGTGYAFCCLCKGVMIMSTIYDALGAHFAKFPHVLECHTGQVTIGKETYPAARYIETLENTPGTQAYARAANGNTVVKFIYCVGMLPSSKLRGNVAYMIEGDQRDWYVACYYGNVTARKQAVAEPNDYHPHGNMFVLAPWDNTDGLRIDHYESVPYRRMHAKLGANWVSRKGST